MCQFLRRDFSTSYQVPLTPIEDRSTKYYWRLLGGSKWTNAVNEMEVMGRKAWIRPWIDSICRGPRVTPWISVVTSRSKLAMAPRSRKKKGPRLKMNDTNRETSIAMLTRPVKTRLQCHRRIILNATQAHVFSYYSVHFLQALYGLTKEQLD